MKLIAVFIFALLFFAGLASCKKAYDTVDTVNQNAVLNVINTSTDTLNFYLNGTRQNINTDIYPAGYTGYLSNFKVGLQNYQFKKSGHPEVLFSKQLTLDDSVSHKRVYNTLFVAGETQDKAFLITDTAFTKAIDSIRVRFAHTASNAPALDVAITDTVRFANEVYKTVTPYKKFAYGTGSKIIKVYLAGQQTVKAADTVVVAVNKAYTIFVKGVPDGTGKNRLQIGVFSN